MLYIESKSDKRIRHTASATVLILALSAGVLSYNALRELAIQAGIPPILAFLFPITLDGLILAGSLLILYFAVRGKRSGYGLFLTALGVIASIAGNVVIAPNNLTYQILHATSPVVLFLALESLMILLRARSKNAIEAMENAEKAKGEATTQSPARLSNSIEKNKATETPSTYPEALESTPAPLEHVSIAPLQAEKTINPTAEPIIPVTQVYPSPAETLSTVKTTEKVTIAPSTVAPIIATTVEVRENPSKSQTSQTVTVPPTVKKNNPPTAMTIDTNQRSKRELIRELLDEDVNMEANDIIDIVKGERKYLQKLIRDERSKAMESVNS